MMNYDLSQTVTEELRLCKVCQHVACLQDKFCRHCGLKHDSNPGYEVGSQATQPLPRVSGPLVDAVVIGVATNTGQIHSLPARRMISALILIPIWLIIILLSPLEAYISARSIVR
jgi:hypothetical protein